MTEFRITMQRAPSIDEAERRRRLSRCYQIILSSARRARKNETTAEESLDSKPRTVVSQTPAKAPDARQL